MCLKLAPVHCLGYFGTSMGRLPDTRARPLPLTARPGARYRCFGDGLCCTDIHGLGPLSKPETKQLSLISAGVVAAPGEGGFDEPMLRTRGDGCCLFLSDESCLLHKSVGDSAKPSGCRRFPLGLTATPAGGRITTRHLCPCRTMGDRPALDERAARAALLDARGQLETDTEVDGPVRIGRRRRVDFNAYETVEARLLKRLEHDEDPADILSGRTLPSLTRGSHRGEAVDMLSDGFDGTRFGYALAWFAESVLALAVGRRPKVHERPWADAFDRAEQRSPEVRPPRAMLADWVADEIWSLDWAIRPRASLTRARDDLCSRLAIADHIQHRLVRRGLRADRATAEALCVVDAVGASDWWTEVVERFSG